MAWPVSPAGAVRLRDKNVQRACPQGVVSRLLELSTGCRLNFGLLELAEGQPNRYGGLGLMLEAPQLRLRWHAFEDEPSPALLAPSVEVERRIQLAQQHALSVLATQYGLSDLVLPGAIQVLDSLLCIVVWESAHNWEPQLRS